MSARARKKLVAFALGRGLSQRRACALFDVPRSTLSYSSKKDVKDAEDIEQMRRISRQHPRWGYRRVRVVLARKGRPMNWKKAHRLWKKAGLQVPPRRRRRKGTKRDPRTLVATAPNQVWAYDFVHDACVDGPRIKCLTIVDEGTREALAIDVAGSIRSERVIEILEELIRHRGAPAFLRSDNGPEFVAYRVQDWLRSVGITTAFIPPGKPWHNAVNESFNGRFRDECLNQEWFRNCLEARVVIEDYRNHFNTERPHSALDYLTPVEYRRRWETLHERRLAS